MSSKLPWAQLCWPLHRLGEALDELARRSGLAIAAPEAPPLAPGLDGNDALELGRWVDWAAQRLGVEAEPVAVPLAGFVPLLRHAAPALLQLPGNSAQTHVFFVLLKARGQRLQLVGPDLQLHQVDAEDFAAALSEPLQAPYRAAIEHLLDVAAVDPARRPRARQALLQEHLATQSVGACWLLRAAPGNSFWNQLRQARLPRKVGWMLLAFAAVYVAEIAGWGLIGQITLNGRLDPGWLAAWALLLFTLVPLRLLGGWLDAGFALEMGRLLKARLLAGILQLDLDSVRKQGAGQMLGQVMESQALESLALNGGMGVLVALLELGLAASVLAEGAGGLWHVLLLTAWLLLTLGWSWRFYQRLRDWTLMRLDMTHALVERMVGHRTRLAQERPGRRDAQEDTDMRDYLDASVAMDRSIVPAAALMPRGWMLVGLLGLLPGFVSGTASPTALGLALGGMLLANRALGGISGGLAALGRAAVAWTQVEQLFKATGQAAASTPFLAMPAEQAGAAPAQAPRRLLEASQLRFGYGDAPVLQGLDLTICRGEQILLEGPSGGGKSTLASLLVGLRQPHAGLILLQGLDHHTLGDAWQQLATEAPQFHENHILSGTLAFNLLMGRNWPASAAELQEAQALCLELGLGDLLQRMPSGLMQMVGETGWQLSHGERSRIFLARALLQNAALTVLDESFAALDPQTLDLCLRCALARSQTLLVIAHP